MKYELTDYKGNIIPIEENETAKKIADIVGLIEIETNGILYYINPSNVASIKPIIIPGYKTPRELGMPEL